MSFLSAGTNDSSMTPFANVLHKDSLLSHVRLAVQASILFLKLFCVKLIEIFEQQEPNDLDKREMVFNAYCISPSQFHQIKSQRIFVSFMLLSIGDVMVSPFQVSDTETQTVTNRSGAIRCLELLCLDNDRKAVVDNNNDNDNDSNSNNDGIDYEQRLSANKCCKHFSKPTST